MNEYKMVRVPLDDDDREKLEELEEIEDIGSHTKMVRTLIRNAHEKANTSEYLYTPSETRQTPLSTDRIRDMFHRYDAPAINPDHVRTWPKTRPEKRQLLAAICRYEYVDTRGGVREKIVEYLGEGDPVRVPEPDLVKDASRRPRNIHHYLDSVYEMLLENPSYESDNTPRELCCSELDQRTFEEFVDTTRNLMEIEGLPEEDYEYRVEIMDEELERTDESHPQYEELVEFREEFVEAVDVLDGE